eukprot:CAMPEP_0196758434 /NCGR_PEP_ID=MMETSP1091-20130531/104186_1 /TAXON_ID=302021 /ORGANISM="Rhodomonas sp., Strain CCMP768" /LENGTH=186 /DNA_ID=CAMNT_0042107257 /DNA_START=264 /DNA_END=824 /DNA_ORIENTATION=-
MVSRKNTVAITHPVLAWGERVFPQQWLPVTTSRSPPCDGRDPMPDVRAGGRHGEARRGEARKEEKNRENEGGDRAAGKGVFSSRHACAPLDYLLPRCFVSPQLSCHRYGETVTSGRRAAGRDALEHRSDDGEVAVEWLPVTTSRSPPCDGRDPMPDVRAVAAEPPDVTRWSTGATMVRLQLGQQPF